MLPTYCRSTPYRCIATITILGLIWFVITASLCWPYYMGFKTTADLNTKLDAKHATVEGKLVDSKSLTIGRRSPTQYQIRYEYPLPGGKVVSSSVTMQVIDMGYLKLTEQEVFFLKDHPRPWKVEYDPAAPEVSRLQGFPYEASPTMVGAWFRLIMGVLFSAFVYFIFVAETLIELIGFWRLHLSSKHRKRPA